MRLNSFNCDFSMLPPLHGMVAEIWDSRTRTPSSESKMTGYSFTECKPGIPLKPNSWCHVLSNSKVFIALVTPDGWTQSLPSKRDVIVV